MKKSLICQVLALALLLTGCGRGLPQAREMENMALMRTMGVDAGDREGDLTVTVSSSRRARGIQGEEENALILSAQRSTVGGACLAMQGLSDSYVFYGHVDQLLLGEELAREGVLEALEHFESDRELGLGTQVWLIRGGSAEDAIRSGEEAGVEQRLSTLRDDGEMGAAGLSRTAGEVLSDLLEDGSAYLPALELSQGDDTALVERGYGVLKEGKLAGWLTGEAARGLELAEGRPGAELLEVEGAVVRLHSAALTCEPVFQGETLTGLELDLRLTAEIEESREVVSKMNLRNLIGQTAQSRLLETVEQLQAWNADCLGLARAAGSSRPEKWDRIRAQWEERFPRLTVSVRCTVLLTGD